MCTTEIKANGRGSKHLVEILEEGRRKKEELRRRHGLRQEPGSARAGAGCSRTGTAPATEGRRFYACR